MRVLRSQGWPGAQAGVPTGVAGTGSTHPLPATGYSQKTSPLRRLRRNRPSTPLQSRRGAELAAGPAPASGAGLLPREELLPDPVAGSTGWE